MYSVQNSTALVGAGRGLLRRRTRAAGVSTTVLLLGTVSLLTDISSEMVAAVLPLYLVYTLGFTPLAFGVIDGIYQGASAIVRIVSGFTADRSRRHKEVASVGYGLSAFCKLALALVGSVWGSIGAIVLFDRTGKGIRTAPRDAMISLSSDEKQLGTAFGVHRAMDTTGAMLGPLIGFALLAIAPLAFKSIFIVSFCFALVGLAVLVLFVRNPSVAPAGGAAPAAEPAPAPPPSPREAAALLRVPAFRRLIFAASLLGLATLSDAFVYLALEQRVDFPTSVFPLLFVGTAAAYMLLAVPAGRLADRIGRKPVFVGGYALLLVVYALLLLPAHDAWVLGPVLMLLGTYYAATDGVLMALASTLCPPELRGTGLAVVGTATSVARLFASIGFGGLWLAVGMGTAIACFGAVLLAALLATAVWLGRGRMGVATG
jgi:MFS family permease